MIGRESWARAATLAAWAAAGCGDATPGPGPGQLLQARALGRPAFVSDDTLVVPRADDGAPERSDLWLVRFSGEPAVVTAAHPVVRNLWTPPPGFEPAASTFQRGGRVFAWHDGDPTWKASLAVIDLAAGVVVSDTEFIVSLHAVIVREDGQAVVGDRALPGDEQPALHLGPPGAPLRIAFPGATAPEVATVVFLGGDALLLARAAPDGGWGLFRVSPDSPIAETLVPPFSDATVPPSDSLLARCAVPGCQSVAVVGCWDGYPACPTGESPCAVAYGRVLGDGTTRPFLYDLVGKQEIPLPGLAPTEGFFAAPDGRTVAWHDPTELPSREDRVRTRDLCTARDNRCSITRASPLVLAWRADGRGFAASLGEPGHMHFVDVRGETCFPPGATTQIGAFGFSPGDAHLAWFEPGEVPSLYVADGWGRDRRKVADGSFAPLFDWNSDGSRLLLSRTADMMLSLSMLDLRGDASDPQPVADSFGPLLVAQRRLLISSAWSNQDEVGNLELFDLDTGARLPIDRPVSSFDADGDVDAESRVAYVVHGRYPSGRDGLWLRTLPPLAP